MSPRLSLVIPAYNEQARLPYTLAQIEAYICREQLDCEVIVVDNGSQDATSAVVQQAAVNFPEPASAAHRPPRQRLRRSDGVAGRPAETS